MGRHPRSPTALAILKPCPKCHGTGKVVCDGREANRERTRLFAEHFDGKPVAYHVEKGTGENETVLGIAMAVPGTGGYWRLQVFFALTDEPAFGRIFDHSDCCAYYKPDGGPAFEIAGIPVWNYIRVARGKAAWYLTAFVGESLTILEAMPAELEEASRLLKEGEVQSR